MQQKEQENVDRECMRDIVAPPAYSYYNENWGGGRQDGAYLRPTALEGKGCNLGIGAVGGRGSRKGQASPFRAST